MSVSTEVRRTLVKSPPELWSELSDPSSLAKHLGELGEIRIVKTDPERVVDWEATAADGTVASGTVQIEPSGWGTKVTLSASLTVAELAAPEHAVAETEIAATEPVATEPEAEPVAVSGVGSEPEIDPEPQPEMTAAPEPEAELESEMAVAFASEPQTTTQPGLAPEMAAEPVSALEPETALKPKTAQEPALEPEPEPTGRPGFFARLFRRRRRQLPELDLPLDPGPAEADRQATLDGSAIEEPAPFAEAPAGEAPVIESPTPAPSESALGQPAAAEPADERPPLEEPNAAEGQTPDEPAAERPPLEEPVAGPDIATELAALEEQTTAVLTGVLDRLGAAHHRPFSRA